MKGIFTTLAISSSLLLAGCNLTDEEKEQLEKAGENLEQLADQIIITYPAKNSTVKNSIVTVRADVPEELNATKVSLFVDGIEIAYDDNGAPWEIEWPAYYWADDNNHSLLLKTTTESGSQVRNNESYQVEVSSEANDMLGFIGNLDGKQLQDTDELAVSFNEVPYATRYEVKYGNKINSETGTTTRLKNLQVGNYQLAYRALYDFSESTTLKGAWSESVAIEILPPEIPLITGPVIGENEKGFTATFQWNSGNTEDKLTFKAVHNSSHQPVTVDVSADKAIVMIEGLDVGDFSWSVELENAYSHKNESEVKNFQINEIAAPVVYEPVKGYTETGHTLDFSWKPVAATDKYSVLVKGFPNENSFVEYESADLTKLLVGELGFGEHEWKIKRTTISGRTVESEVRTSRILEPLLKREFSTSVVKEATSGYKVSFSGDESGLDGSSYQIGLKLNSALEQFADCTTICSFPSQKTGIYSYSIKRINPVGQFTYKRGNSLEVGVFNTRLGGSKDDSPSQIIHSPSNGYLIRAVTSSYEITESLIGGSDDWVIRVDDNGNLVDEFIENKAGRARYNDMIEVDDGSIFLVGDDKGTGAAVITKLDKNLETVWNQEVQYRPSPEFKYSFNYISEAGENIYVGLVKRDLNGSSTYLGNTTIHYVDPINGGISEALSLPSISGVRQAYVSLITTNLDGHLVIVGAGKPDPSSEYPGMEGGVYMLALDSEFKEVSQWHNVEDSDFIWVGDVKYMSSGKVVIFGMGESGAISIGSLYPNGSMYRHYRGTYDEYFTNSNIAELSDGTLMSFVSQYENGSTRYLLKGFNDYLTPVETKYLDINGSISPRGLIVNEDDSITLLYSQGQDGYANDDIIVQRIPPISQ